MATNHFDGGGLEALFAFDKDSEPRTRALLMTFAEAKKNGGIINPP
jgi:hypothetical protein